MLRATFRMGLVAVVLMAGSLHNASAAEVGQELIDKAKAERQVNFYTVDIFTKPITDAFEKKYGIKVNTLRLDSNDIILRVTNEFRADHPVADVISIALGINTLIDGKMLRPFKAANAEEMDAKYRDPKGYWAAVVRQLHTGIVNTSLVSKEERPKTYEDLLNPKWKGQIAWKPYDITGAVGFIGHILALRGEDAGMDFLRKLSKQDVKALNMSANALSDQVNAGEYAIAVQVLSNHVERNVAAGGPVDYLNLFPIAVSLDVAALTTNGPHPNAALLLAEFLTSKEGQALYGQKYIPARSDVPKSSPYKLDDPSKLNVINPDMIRTGLDRWTSTFNRLYR